MIFPPIIYFTSLTSVKASPFFFWLSPGPWKVFLTTQYYSLKAI